MKTFRLYLLYKCLILIMVLTLSGCAIKFPPPKYLLNNERFNDLKTVGIIVRIDSIRLIMTNDADNFNDYVYDYLQSSKYTEPLNFVYNKINSKSEIRIFYEGLLKEKGISVKEFEYKQPPPYPPERKEVHFPFDSKNLVNHFSKDDEIDAILIVDVMYGLKADEYFYVIDIVTGTDCTISSRIVDMKDGSIIYNSYGSWGHKKIKDKWNTPPEYENLINSFKSAFLDAFEEEKTKFNLQPKNKPSQK